MSHTFVYVASALVFDDRACLILVFLDQKTKMLDRVKWLLQKIQEPHP